MINENTESLRTPSFDLTHLVEKILRIKEQLKKYQSLMDQLEDNKALFQWFLKELEELPDYDPNIYRLPFRMDLFEKLVEHISLNNNISITYLLKF